MDKIDREMKRVSKFPGFRINHEASIRGQDNWLYLSDAARILRVPCSRLLKWCRLDPEAKLVTRVAPAGFQIHRAALSHRIKLKLSLNPVKLSDGRQFYW